MFMQHSRDWFAACSQLTTLTESPCSLSESHNCNATRVTMPNQFRHLSRELCNRNGPPAITQSSNAMEHQNMPAARPHPAIDVLCTMGANKVAAYALKIGLANQATVYLQLVDWIVRRIIRIIGPPSCLLIPRVA